MSQYMPNNMSAEASLCFTFAAFDNRPIVLMLYLLGRVTYIL